MLQPPSYGHWTYFLPEKKVVLQASHMILSNLACKEQCSVLYERLLHRARTGEQDSCRQIMPEVMKIEKEASQLVSLISESPIHHVCVSAILFAATHTDALIKCNPIVMHLSTSPPPENSRILRQKADQIERTRIFLVHSWQTSGTFLHTKGRRQRDSFLTSCERNINHSAAKKCDLGRLEQPCRADRDERRI